MSTFRPASWAGLVVVLLLGSASVGRADEIVLANGDRITGTIQGLTDSKIVVKTDYAGDIKIDLAGIASLRTDAEMTLVLNDDTRLYGRLSGDGKSLRITTAAAGPQPVERARVGNLLRGQVTGEEWTTTGRANVGAADTDGNTEVRRINVDAEMIMRNARNRFTVGGRGNYATDAGAETESNAIVFGKYDRFVSPKWYYYANTLLENDKLKDVYLRSTIGAGSGYQVYESKLTNWQVEGGLEYVNADYYSAPSNAYPGLRLATRYDRWLWQDFAQFFLNGSVTVSLESTEDAFARTQTGLRFPLQNGLLASLQLNLDWDGNPAPGRESVDRTVVMSLGYKW